MKTLNESWTLNSPLTVAISAAPLPAYVCQVRIIFQEWLTVDTPQLHYYSPEEEKERKPWTSSWIQRWEVKCVCCSDGLSDQNGESLSPTTQSWQSEYIWTLLFLSSSDHLASEPGGLNMLPCFLATCTNCFVLWLNTIISTSWDQKTVSMLQRIQSKTDRKL